MRRTTAFVSRAPCFGARTVSAKHERMSDGTGASEGLSLPEVTQPLSIVRRQTLTSDSAVFRILCLSFEVFDGLLRLCVETCVFLLRGLSRTELLLQVHHLRFVVSGVGTPSFYAPTGYASENEGERGGNEHVAEVGYDAEH